MQIAGIKSCLPNDKIFNKINQLFINLPAEDVKRNNLHLSKILNQLQTDMKSQSELFKKLFNKPVWVGSFSKKTKVGFPEEYDINLEIKLPIKESNFEFSSDYPGYTKIRWISDTDNMHHVFSSKQESFFDDECYLNQEKFRSWTKGILKRAIDYNNMLTKTYSITVSESGPAFTLALQISNNIINMDLVPVLAFSSNVVPCGKTNILLEFPERRWFAIPKPLNNKLGFGTEQHRYWKLNFFEYEKDILSKFSRAKEIVRYLKKLRDTQKWKSIASYYIETLCLHELHIFEDSRGMSSTSLFLAMLRKLHDALHNHCIPFYWDRNMNLLADIGFSEIKDMERRLFHIIKDIEGSIKNDPLAIAKYVLTEEEMNVLCTKLRNS